MQQNWPQDMNLTLCGGSVNPLINSQINIHSLIDVVITERSIVDTLYHCMVQVTPADRSDMAGDRYRDKSTQE